MNTAIFERFRKGCDTFFEKKTAFFSNLKDELNANLAKKKELVEKAEALMDSTEWRSTGDILINLDSETEGELYVGCAGGLDASATASYIPADYDKNWLCYSLAVKGFKGGHSGMDIILCRGNANKVAARILYALMTEADVKLLDLEGGTLRNAIPREAFATVYVPAEKLADAKLKMIEGVKAKDAKMQQMIAEL
mgnify:CR=1 FL=1